RIDATLLELGGDLGFDVLEFRDMRVEIATLVFEIGDVQAAAPQQLAQLLHASAVDLVEVEQFLDLRQRKAQPLAAQDPAQPHAIVRAVEPRQPLALGLDQALIFVKADGAGGNGELASKLGDAVDALRIAWRCALGRGGNGHGGALLEPPYVNVN